MITFELLARAFEALGTTPEERGRLFEQAHNRGLLHGGFFGSNGRCPIGCPLAALYGLEPSADSPRYPETFRRALPPAQQDRFANFWQAWDRYTETLEDRSPRALGRVAIEMMKAASAIGAAE